MLMATANNDRNVPKIMDYQYVKVMAGESTVL